MLIGIIRINLDITLNNILYETFSEGREELAEAVSAAIAERQNNIEDAAGRGEKEYAYIQAEIDELKSVDPYRDMSWYCNCLDTHVFLTNNEGIYRKYLTDAIKDIENNMGFIFE